MFTIDQIRGFDDLPVVISSREGIIVFVNKNFEETYRWSPGELAGKTLSTLIPAVFKDAHHLGFSRFLLTEKSQILNQALELQIMTGDGREVSAEHHIIAEKLEGEWLFGAVITSMSNR